MCGIAGLIELGGVEARQRLEARAGAMGGAMPHRGPDQSAVWAAPDSGVAFAFRRLAILDLSEAGHQPMTSRDGRWTICYNGEIYSYRAIRADMEARGIVFRGTSDTEAMLEHIAAFGIEATLPRLVGMFAIALWDARERRLHLIRDRLGIKPVYWGEAESRFLFASELKCIRAALDSCPQIDRKALTDYIALNNVPGARTIYRGFQKLEPGCWLSVSPGERPVIRRYWSMADVVSQPRRQLSDAQAIEEAEAMIREAVSCRMIADVPLGALLSGGVDSSTVVAAMQAAASGPVKTFTIGFGEAGYDEAAHARAVAAHLGTEHTELRLGASDALALIPSLPDWYDEPFADSSALPTYLVSRLAKGSVTVALSGDGGDEVFFGYNRHVAGPAAMRRMAPLPGALRDLAAGALSSVSTSRWDGLARLLPESRRPRMLGDKLHKLARVMAARSVEGMYQALIARWQDPSRLTGFDARLDDGPAEFTLPQTAFQDDAERLAALDTIGYLPGDILTKVDRASMAVSLEARVPLLDHRLVEFAWTLPTALKIRDGRGKWLLRQVLYRHVPRELVDRPKSGFAIPLADWLRGPLKPWAGDLLNADSMRRTGLIDPAPIARAWDEHLAGKGNHAEGLWTILMLEAWAARWLGA